VRFLCLCGNGLSNAGSPNDTEHFLLSSRSIERLHDVVAVQLASGGRLDLSSDSWEKAGAIEVWKCSDCQRLYVSPNDGFEKVVVYKIEQVGV